MKFTTLGAVSVQTAELEVSIENDTGKAALDVAATEKEAPFTTALFGACVVNTMDCTPLKTGNV